jgi:hypothetical protein
MTLRFSHQPFFKKNIVTFLYGIFKMTAALEIKKLLDILENSMVALCPITIM